MTTENFDKVPFSIAEALTMPLGRYVDPAQGGMMKGNVTLVAEQGFVIKQHGTEKPVLAALEVNKGLAIIVYNPHKKLTVFTHQPDFDENLFNAMVGFARSGAAADPLEVHIIGRNLDPRKGFPLDKTKPNYAEKEVFEKIVHAVHAENAKLVTFDVLHKPKPHTVAFNTDTAQLINVTGRFYTSTQEVTDDITRHEPRLHMYFDAAGKKLINEIHRQNAGKPSKAR